MRFITMRSQLKLYVSRQATSLGRYIWEQLVEALVGWVPSVLGVGLRAVVYRGILRADGAVAIEDGVRGMAFIEAVIKSSEVLSAMPAARGGDALRAASEPAPLVLGAVPSREWERMPAALVPRLSSEPGKAEARSAAPQATITKRPMKGTYV